MSQEIKIHVHFREDTKYGNFADTLIFTEAEWATNPDIATLKQARVDKWVAYMDSTKAPQPEPTKEQLLNYIQEQISEIESRISKWNEKKVELNLKMAAL